MLVWIWMVVVVLIVIAGIRLRATTEYLQTAIVCFVGVAANSGYLAFICLSPEAKAAFGWVHTEFVIIFVIIELGFLGMFLYTLWNLQSDRDDLLLEINYLDEEKEAVRKEIAKPKSGYKVEDE